MCIQLRLKYNVFSNTFRANVKRYTFKAFGRPCQLDSNCGGPDGMFRCDGINDTCVCGDNYIPIHNITYDGLTNYEYYNLEKDDEIICLPRKLEH